MNEINEALLKVDRFDKISVFAVDGTVQKNHLNSEPDLIHINRVASSYF
jgi:hypothetical protein